MEEEPTSPCGESWVSMAMRVKHQVPHHNMLYRDLAQILPTGSEEDVEETVQSLKDLSMKTVLASDALSWRLACSCPPGMFDYALQMFVKELALRYRFNCGQRLQYNLTRSIVRLSLHCSHNTLTLIDFLRGISRLFHSSWFRWSSCRYHPADDVAAMWAFYAELADALAVGYVVPRLYERSVPCLPHLDLSGIPRLRDSTWSLRNIYDAGNKELNPLLDCNTLQLTMDLEIEGMDRKKLRLLHRLAMDRRRCDESEGKDGKFLLGLKHVYVTSLATDDWDTVIEDIQAFPELCHLTLNMCSLTSSSWEHLKPLAATLTGLALTNNPELHCLDNLVAFTKLEVLDLSNLDLRGLLEPVTSLTCGLRYLCLSGCRLGTQELVLLTASAHTATLHQLDISDNSAKGKPDFYRAFIDLLEALQQVQVLNISHCHVTDPPEELKACLESAVRSLSSSLRLLAVSSKEFSASSLHSVLEAIDCKIFYTV